MAEAPLSAIKPREFFEYIKTFHVGQRVEVVAKDIHELKRSKIVYGTIVEIYPFHFVIEYDKTRLKESFRYIEGLIGGNDLRWKIKEEL